MPPKHATPVESDKPTFATFLPSHGATSETTEDNNITFLRGSKEVKVFLLDQIVMVRKHLEDAELG
jgi:hypothetical protein